MSANSTAFLHHQEQLAFEEPTLNELVEHYTTEPELTPMQKHAALLDQRNELIELAWYSNKVGECSISHKDQWKETYERQYAQLMFIEGILLETESAAS